VASSPEPITVPSTNHWVVEIAVNIRFVPLVPPVVVPFMVTDMLPVVPKLVNVETVLPAVVLLAVTAPTSEEAAAFVITLCVPADNAAVTTN
jgi:hypothetical protein